MGCNCGNDNQVKKDDTKKDKNHHKEKKHHSSENSHKKCECKRDKDCKGACGGRLGCCSACVDGKCVTGMLTSGGDCVITKPSKHHYYKKHNY